MKSTSALLASAFLLGCDAACNQSSGACVFAGAPFQSSCYMVPNATSGPQSFTCNDCPVGETNNYYAMSNATTSMGIYPTGTNPLADDTNSCTSQPSCATKFNDKYLPWPHWMGLLSNPDALPGFTDSDVPDFVKLIYGFYGGAYPTAQPEDMAADLGVNETNEVYVELFANTESDCYAPSPTCPPLATAGGTLPYLNGLKFAVSECTKLIFNGGPVFLQFRSGETDNGEVSCDYGMFAGHACDWGADLGPGTKIDEGKIPDTGSNATCHAFPAGQGFKMKIHCHSLDANGDSTAELKEFRNPSNAILDRALHDSTCIEEGRIVFPCQYPAYCPSVVWPSDAGPSDVMKNATLECKDLVLGNNCTATKLCLEGYAGVTDLEFYTDCISTMCDDPDEEGSDDSSASVVAASLVMSFLALF